MRHFIFKEDEEEKNEPLEGGLDIALAGEIYLFSDKNEIFFERKQNIAKAFVRTLPLEEITSDYISKTPIFKYYIRDLKIWYKKEVDENMKINISTEEDLIRQVSDSILLLAKNVEF